MTPGGGTLVRPPHQRPHEPTTLILPVRGHQLDLAGGEPHIGETQFLIKERRGGDDPIAVDHHGAGRPPGVGIRHDQPVVEGVGRLTAFGEECTDLVKVRRTRLSQDETVSQRDRRGSGSHDHAGDYPTAQAARPSIFAAIH
ncbi:hypothetical protein GCM10023075_20670 [Streptosporangium album]